MARPFDPPFSFPFDILHVSDTHFRAAARANRPHLDEWQRLLTDVEQRIADREFAPDLIAFTGDLIETAVGRAPWAMRNGVHALLELAKVCGFIERVPSQDTWPETLPEEWWQLFNRRIVLVPGNHDVFCWGLRCLWHRRAGPWQRGVFKQSASTVISGAKRFGNGQLRDKQQRVVGTRQLIPESDCAIGPLAVRLIDCSGTRQLFGLGTVAYEPGLGGADAWDLADVSGRFGIALVHGHPIELPFYLHGMFDGARGMLMENAGLLLKSLAQLNVRLVLHGHRHYPGTWGITLPDAEGHPKPLVIVGAGSPTKAPSQWRNFSYNWIRIHPDRKVKVTILERPRGDGVFVRSRNQPFTADRGDFWYERVERHITVNGAGDISAEARISGFRVVAGRPPVRAIPFRLDPAGLGYLAAWQFSAEPKRDKRLPWTQHRSVIELDPPHAADDPPIDVLLRHYIHNAMVLSLDEGREMGFDGDWEWTKHVLRCETGVLKLSATLPPCCGDLAPEDRQVQVLDERHVEDRELGERLTEDCRWDPGTRTLSVETRLLPPYGTMRLKWRLKRDGASPPQDLARTMQTLRRWQQCVLAETRKGVRPLDELCAAILSSLSYPDIDVTLFVPEMRSPRSAAEGHTVGVPTSRDSSNTATPVAVPNNGGIVLAGAAPVDSQGASPVRFGFGEGIAGRVLRTCRLHIHDVVPEEDTLRIFEAKKRPSNFYRPVVPDVPQYERLVMAPVFPFDELAAHPAFLARPDFVTVAVCVGSKKPTSSFTRASKDTLIQLMLQLTRRVSQWISESAADTPGGAADRWSRTTGALPGRYEIDDDVSAENTSAYRYVP